MTVTGVITGDIFGKMVGPFLTLCFRILLFSRLHLAPWQKGATLEKPLGNPVLGVSNWLHLHLVSVILTSKDIKQYFACFSLRTINHKARIKEIAGSLSK